MWFWDDFAFQPAHTAFYQRRANCLCCKRINAIVGKLVRTRQITATDAANLFHHLNLLHARQVYRKCAFSCYQFTRIGFAVDDDRHFGWIKVQRTHPGRCHDITLATMCRRNQGGWAVIEQSIRMQQRNIFSHLNQLNYVKNIFKV